MPSIFYTWYLHLNRNLSIYMYHTFIWSTMALHVYKYKCVYYLYCPIQTAFFFIYCWKLCRFLFHAYESKWHLSTFVVIVPIVEYYMFILAFFHLTVLLWKPSVFVRKILVQQWFFFKSLSNLVIIQLSTNCNFYIICYIDHDFVFCNFSLYMVFILFYALLFKIVD